MANLYVRSWATREVVKTIDVGDKPARRVEKIVRGLLHQMNTEEYYVDDSEVPEELEGEEE